MKKILFDTLKVFLGLTALSFVFAQALASDAPSTPPVSASVGAPQKSPAPEDDLSKALVNKIKAGSGDIVIRTSDIPAGSSEPKVEVKTVAVKPNAKKSEKGATEQHNEIHWSYFDGPGGPENWGEISKANLACSKGKTQSPININVDNAVKVDLDPLEFMYRPSPLSIVDNGHTVMVNYGEGSNLLVNGRQYRLIQFHFHKPSEEAINGERMDMVVHLVHQHHDGSLAVVGVLMSTKGLSGSDKKSWWGSSYGQANPLISTLWNNLPLVKEKVSSPGVLIDVNQLLPNDKAFYTYMGSLTTPPCSENVLWFVMKNPISVSEDQVKNFGRLYPMNARPLQPKGDRLVKESKGS